MGLDASEILLVERDGKNLMSNLNKNGYVYVYIEIRRVKQYMEVISDRKLGKVNLKTGEITDRYFGVPVKKNNLPLDWWCKRLGSWIL